MIRMFSLSAAHGLRQERSRCSAFLQMNAVGGWNPGAPRTFPNFLRRDLAVIKWIRKTKRTLKQAGPIQGSNVALRNSLYRPFVKQQLNFTPYFIEDLYSQPRFFPSSETEAENRLIVLTMHSQTPFTALAANLIPCRDVGGRPSQTIPFYVYDASGGNRQENITDWALSEFRTHYADQSITKWDIFHATYAILHHPGYRTRYAANLSANSPASHSHPTSTPSPKPASA